MSSTTDGAGRPSPSLLGHGPSQSEGQDGFGFTSFQVFQKLHEAEILQRAQAPRNFGTALVLLGLTMLILGIAYHLFFMLELRRQRHAMTAQGLIHGETRFPASLTLIVALLLLLIGLLAITSMLFSVGPFGQ